MQHGMARHSTAWHHTAEHHVARHGMAEHRMARHGTAQHGTARHGTLLLGQAPAGSARQEAPTQLSFPTQLKEKERNKEQTKPFGVPREQIEAAGLCLFSPSLGFRVNKRSNSQLPRAAGGEGQGGLAPHPASSTAFILA